MSWLGEEIKKHAATSRVMPEGTSLEAFHAMSNTIGPCSFVVEDREDPKLAAGIVVDDKAPAKRLRTGTLRESAVEDKIESASASSDSDQHKTARATNISEFPN